MLWGCLEPEEGNVLGVIFVGGGTCCIGDWFCFFSLSFSEILRQKTVILKEENGCRESKTCKSAFLFILALN